MDIGEISGGNKNSDNNAAFVRARPVPDSVLHTHHIRVACPCDLGLLGLRDGNV